MREFALARSLQNARIDAVAKVAAAVSGARLRRLSWVAELLARLTRAKQPKQSSRRRSSITAGALTYFRRR